MSQWLQSAKATVSAGASVISFTDNKDFASVRAGDVVMINGQIWQCASGTRPDSAGQSLINLAAPWPYTGASNVNAFVFRTTHDLLQLTSDARKLTNITKALLAAQEDILKGTTPTINVPIGLDPATGKEEVIEVTPWQYVINTVNASLGNISAIGAMSQVQFEAIRDQNKEKYAASAWVHKGKHYHANNSDYIAINEGLWTNTVGANNLQLGKSLAPTPMGNSKSDAPVMHIAGVIFYLSDINTVSSNQNTIKFPQAPDGKTTYNKSTGVITNHATVAAAFNAQAVDPTNVEVVTDRVDMWGFETWLEEVNTTNPYVYQNGLIQSQVATMDGISTSSSNRPVTYYAVFDGDTGSKGKGLNFFALTDAQKKKVLANPKNNLYYLDDGRLVQWRLRQRTIAGAGNGDWISVSPATDSFSVRFSENNDVIPQGILDITLGRKDTQYFYSSNNPPSSLAGSGFIGDVGSYQISPYSANLCGIYGQCYFLVCGTVNRLNQGAYHPSFNPNGAALLSQFGVNTWQWHQLPNHITSRLSCFLPATASSVGSRGGSIAEGSVLAGRPDGRYYDAIYASGQGGVCRDMRYSAKGVDAVDFAEADQRVKNGSYRGFEKPIITHVVQESYPLDTVVDAHFILAPSIFKGNALARTALRVGGTFNKYYNGVLYSSTITNLLQEADGNQLVIYTSDFIPRNAGTLSICPVMSDSSVGGSFLQTDVIGNPANILATPALANGWQGSWGGLPVNGAPIQVPLSRKCLSSQVYTVYKTAGGWGVSSTELVTPSSNTVTHAATDVNSVLIEQYQAFAKQTENAVSNQVYGGSSGVGVVAVTGGYLPYYGALWMESIVQKVATGGANIVHNVTMKSYGFFYGGKLLVDADYPIAHNQINIASSNNSSPSVKALNYNVNINQQANIQYAYTELKHNGTSWGDDGKVTIVDNQSTKTDLNGNTVLVGTAKLKEPLGWIKSKV